MKIRTAFFFLLLAISIGLNNIVIGYKVAGISYDRVIQLVYFIIFTFIFRDYYKSNVMRYLLITIFAFAFLYVFGKLSLIIQGEDFYFADVARGLIRTIMYFIFVFIIFILLDKYKWTIQVILVVFFFAFLFAFFQNPLTPFTEVSQELRLTLFSQNMKETDLNIYSNFLDDKSRLFTRVSGPYGQTITLSYALVSSSILSAFYYIERKKTYYMLFIIFAFIVSIMTLTRSAVLAIFVLLVYLLLSSKRNILIGFLSLLMITIAFFTFYDLNEFKMFERVVSSDESSSGKVGLIFAGIAALLANPFGVSDGNYYEMKELSFSIFNSLEILRYPSHNGLINLGFEYTSLVYIPFFWFVYKVCEASKGLNFKEKRFWAVAWFSFFIQQSFHNNGLFFVEFNILIVLSLFMYRINKSNL